MAQGSDDPTRNEPAGADLDATLEAEIEAALGEMSAEDMLDLGAPVRQSGAQRDVRSGTVVSIHGHDVMVEFGPRSQGICPIDQFDEAPEPGQRLDFTVDRVDEREGLLVLSRRGAVQKAQWDSLDVGQIVEARCVGMVKGGLEMSVAQHKAFMPASQVDVHYVKDISIYLNEKVTCEVVELDRRRGRILLSRRRVVEAEQQKQRESLLETLEPGQKLSATIRSIQPYGAFADLGGLDGLIHVSDMSYERINHPSEVLKEGDVVDVQVLKIDRRQAPPRVSLGMKQTMTDPFQAKLDELEEGQSVSGRITKLMPFGAFMEVAPGVEGLIHISQLAHERISRPAQVVQPGEVVTAKVLSIDPESRRISLSLKALREARAGQAAGGRGGEDEQLSRREDPALRKLKAQLSRKFGDNLKGGIG